MTDHQHITLSGRIPPRANSSDWVILEITEEDKRLAEEMGNKQRDIDLRLSFRNKFGGREANIIGWLGQIKFKEFLDDNNIIHSSVEIGETPDTFDFKINGKIIDVKTEKSKKYSVEELLRRKGIKNLYFLRLIEDVDPKNTDFFVFIILDKYLDKAYIIGFVTKKQLMTYPKIIPKFSRIKKLSYQMPLSNFHPIQELKEGLA